MKHVQNMWRILFQKTGQAQKISQKAPMRRLLASRRARGCAGVAVLAAALAGCGETKVDSRPYEKHSDGVWRRGEEQRETIFGKGGLNLFGGKSRGEDGGSHSGIGVNAFLWRASLDTVSFMPLASADPFGGVIITDWYTPPETPKERFKVNVYILGRTLRADGIKATVFRQKYDSSKKWVDVATSSSVTTELEDAILSRARELRHTADGGA